MAISIIVKSLIVEIINNYYKLADMKRNNTLKQRLVEMFPEADEEKFDLKLENFSKAVGAVGQFFEINAEYQVYLDDKQVLIDKNYSLASKESIDLLQEPPVEK